MKPAKKKKPGEKLNNISPEYDSVREQTVLLESMNQNIKAIAEGHADLDRKLNEANAKLDDHTKRLDRFGMDTLRMSNALCKVELDIVNLKTTTQRIEQKLDIVITDHEQRINKLEEKVLT